MSLAMATLASILLSTSFRSASAQAASQPCFLSYDEGGVSWIIRIYRNEETSSHGALVSVNRVLSVFSPYISAAKSNAEAKTYDFVAYSETEGYCHQTRKANKIIPPPEWKLNPSYDVTARPFEQVGRDIAFWEISQDFDVYLSTFKFLFPNDDDITEISNAISSASIGTECSLTTFSEKSSFRTGSTNNRQVTLSSVDSCEAAYCSEHMCHLGTRYDYCVQEEINAGGWKRGAMLTCNGAQIAILAYIGGGRRTKGRNLFINLLTAWDVFKRNPNTRPTDETPTSTSTAGNTIQQSTTWTRTAATIASTLSDPCRATNATTALYNLTSRIPQPQNQTRISTKMPTFVRTIPRHAKPTSASRLLACSGALALCCVVIIL